jgi:hypothetical protein
MGFVVTLQLKKLKFHGEISLQFEQDILLSWVFGHHGVNSLIDGVPGKRLSDKKICARMQCFILIGYRIISSYHYYPRRWMRLLNLVYKIYAVPIREVIIQEHDGGILYRQQVFSFVYIINESGLQILLL